MRSLVLLTSISALALCGGCSVHNINETPAPSVIASQAYSLGGINGTQQTEIDNVWWAELNRPQLNVLITESFEANQDIVQAIARIQQARALQLSTNAGRFPMIDLEGDISKDWEGSDGESATSEIGAALSWEIDIFNRIGAAARADELETVARIEDLNALRLSLSAEVANAYFGAVSAHNILQLLNNQLKTDKDLLELIKLRQENGVGTSVEVLQQESRVAESESLIPLAEAQLRVFENRLDVLLGQAPDGQNRVNPSDNLAFASKLPSVGVPADLLFKRPDLRAAQAELVAADADIAAAIAERLPQITLEGSYLYSDTVSYAGPLGMIMGSFVQPLLDWGRRRAEVARNKAVYTERLAAFTQTYLMAVEEVENTLYQEGKQREYISRLEKRRKILQNTVEETEALYTQGVDDYLPVLNALQELRSVERDLVAERLNLVNFRIALHRALGGKTNHTLNQEGS